MKKIKGKNLLLLFLLILVVGYTVNFFYGAIRDFINNPMKASKVFPTNYRNLFNLNEQKNISVIETTSYKLRDTISYLEYGNKYDILITRFKTISQFHIDDIALVNEPINDSNVPEGITPFDNANFVAKFKFISSGSTSKIILSLYGDSIRKIALNDAILCYYSKIKSGFIKSNVSDNYDVTFGISPHNHTSKIQPIIICMIKQQNYLYLLTMTSIKSSDQLNPTVLYKLIK